MLFVSWNSIKPEFPIAFAGRKDLVALIRDMVYIGVIKMRLRFVQFSDFSIPGWLESVVTLFRLFQHWIVILVMICFPIYFIPYFTTFVNFPFCFIPFLSSLFLISIPFLSLIFPSPSIFLIFTISTSLPSPTFPLLPSPFTPSTSSLFPSIPSPFFTFTPSLPSPSTPSSSTRCSIPSILCSLLSLTCSILSLGRSIPSLTGFLFDLHSSLILPIDFTNFWINFGLIFYLCFILHLPFYFSLLFCFSFTLLSCLPSDLFSIPTLVPLLPSLAITFFYPLPFQLFLAPRSQKSCHYLIMRIGLCIEGAPP